MLKAERDAAVQQTQQLQQELVIVLRFSLDQFVSIYWFDVDNNKINLSDSTREARICINLQEHI